MPLQRSRTCSSAFRCRPGRTPTPTSTASTCTTTSSSRRTSRGGIATPAIRNSGAGSSARPRRRRIDQWLLAKFKAARAHGRARAAARSRAAVVSAVVGGDGHRRREDASRSSPRSPTTAGRSRRPPVWISTSSTSALGSEADFAGRDVNGKAASSSACSASARAKGGAAPRGSEGRGGHLRRQQLPGNLQLAVPSGTRSPAFTLGHDDGIAARDLIGADAGRAIRRA